MTVSAQASESDRKRELISFIAVPLGNRRRFGPAPVEDNVTPQLAQPSPSAYPRHHSQDRDSPAKRGRDETPSSGDPKGKPH